MSNGLVDKILQHFPELGDLDELTMEDIERFLQQPDAQEKLEEIMEMLTPLGDADLEGRDHMMAAPGGVGREQLDPNWQAALIERLQFDGDVPEYRVGRLQSDKGQKAAVPVQTNSMNPLQVGRALQTASEEVTAEAQRLLEDTEGNTERYFAALSGDERKMLEAGISEALVKQTTDMQVAQRLPLPEVMAVPDPEGYAAGQLPALREVETESATALVSLPKAERQTAVWAVASTTQGRKSAVHPIAQTLCKKLGVRYQVEVGTRFQEPLVVAQWQRRLDDAEHTNPDFNPMSTAAAVLYAKLLKEASLYDLEDRELLISVRPLSAIADRRVGWVAELRFKHDHARIEA